MDTRGITKAFFAGVFSIFPFIGDYPYFKSVDTKKSLVVPKNSSVPPVKVKLRPVFEDVGECFDDAGDKLRLAMRKLVVR